MILSRHPRLCCHLFKRTGGSAPVMHPRSDVPECSDILHCCEITDWSFQLSVILQ